MESLVVLIKQKLNFTAKLQGVPRNSGFRTLNLEAERTERLVNERYLLVVFGSGVRRHQASSRVSHRAMRFLSLRAQ